MNEREKAVKETVNKMSDFVNAYSSRNADFCKFMGFEHRTLQQSFTKLCLEWIETVASDDYMTDGRNESSKKVAKTLIENSKEDFYEKPSSFIPLI